MKLKWALTGAAILTMGAAPVTGQDGLHFYNVCSAGAFRVCASADVTVGPDNTLIMNVWNMSQPTPIDPATGRPTDLSSYYSETGGWHTIAAVGLSNVGYSLEGMSTTVEASYFNGSTYETLSKWSGVAGANMLRIQKTGADTDGDDEGIVGCFDPGPVAAGHVMTCGSYPSSPFVRFTLSGFASLDLSNAEFSFHSRQVAHEAYCDPTRWHDVACTGSAATGASVTIASEPVAGRAAMFIGFVLVGVGAVARNRRRGEQIASV